MLGGSCLTMGMGGGQNIGGQIPNQEHDGGGGWETEPEGEGKEEGQGKGV